MTGPWIDSVIAQDDMDVDDWTDGPCTDIAPDITEPGATPDDAPAATKTATETAAPPDIDAGTAAAAPHWDPTFGVVRCGDKSRFVDDSITLSELHRLITGGDVTLYRKDRWGKLRPIVSGSTLRDNTSTYRNLLARRGKDGPGVGDYKTAYLPGVIVGGDFPIGSPRGVNFPSAHSRMVQFDFDAYGESASQVTAALREHAALVFTSPSGGPKAFLPVCPTPGNSTEHSVAWEQASRWICDRLGMDFDAVSDSGSKLVDRTVRSPNGLCFLAHDESAYLNLHAAPIRWTPPPETPAKAPRGPQNSPATPRTGNPLPNGDMAALCDYVLDEVLPNDYDDREDWMSILHYAKGGGASFAAFDRWSQQHSTYDPVETQRAWDSAEPGRTTGAALLWLADQRCPGWRRSQNGGSMAEKKTNPRPYDMRRLAMGVAESLAVLPQYEVYQLPGKKLGISPCPKCGHGEASIWEDPVSLYLETACSNSPDATACNAFGRGAGRQQLRDEILKLARYASVVESDPGDRAPIDPDAFGE